MKMSLWQLIKKNWKEQFLLEMLAFQLKKLKCLKSLNNMEK